MHLDAQTIYTIAFGGICVAVGFVPYRRWRQRKQQAAARYGR